MCVHAADRYVDSPLQNFDNLIDSVIIPVGLANTQTSSAREAQGKWANLAIVKLPDGQDF